MSQVPVPPLFQPPPPPGDDRCCDYCGQKIRKDNPHHMDFAKVKVLDQIARLNRAGEPWIKLQRDGNLIADDAKGRTIQCDDVHGLRLKWFGLVDSKGHRTGEYRCNGNGYLFLAGRLPVPVTIWCKDGEVVRKSLEMAYVQNVKDVILDKAYWDGYWREQG